MEYTLEQQEQLREAAPAMYEALLAIINSETITNENFNLALAALAQAEGREQ